MLRYDESCAAKKQQNAGRQEHSRTIPAFFYSFDCNEPEHVQRENRFYKYWLTPLLLGRNDGFSARELNQVRAQIALNMETILEAWDEHCG